MNQRIADKMLDRDSQEILDTKFSDLSLSD